jgi:hypothetical protein
MFYEPSVAEMLNISATCVSCRSKHGDGYDVDAGRSSIQSR